MLTLYYAPGACSLAPHIGLEEAGATFEAKPVNMMQGEHKSPDYLKINPNGQVPTLVVDGKVLTENVAILTWIAEQHPQAKLMPTEPWKRIQALSLLARCSSDIHKGFGVLFRPQALVSDEKAREEFVKNVREMCAGRMAALDARLAGKDYALGAFSVIDCYMFVFWNWAGFLGVDVGKLANYAKHAERMKARPAVARVLAREGEARQKLSAA